MSNQAQADNEGDGIGDACDPDDDNDTLPDDTYRLEASDEVPGAWRFVHDPVQQSFTAMDFGPDPVAITRFEERHEVLSTSPDSGFVRVLKLLRREPATAYGLTGCVLHRQDASSRDERVLTSRTEWFDAVADVFGMPLAEIDDAGRDWLWQWLSESHETWLAADAESG